LENEDENKKGLENNKKESYVNNSLKSKTTDVNIKGIKNHSKL
jgi:hypothetical protein